LKLIGQFYRGDHVENVEGDLDHGNDVGTAGAGGV
jgi:hypothetical protein